MGCNHPRINSQKAYGENFKINLVINDTSGKALIQVKNSVLNYLLNDSSADAKVSAYMPRKTLEQLALNPSVPPANVTTTGDSSVFKQFADMLDMFKPGFNNILP